MACPPQERQSALNASGHRVAAGAYHDSASFRSKKRCVPVDRAAQAVVQDVGRSPAEHLARLLRVEPLDGDLAGRDVLHVWRRASSPSTG